MHRSRGRAELANLTGVPLCHCADYGSDDGRRLIYRSKPSAKQWTTSSLPPLSVAHHRLPHPPLSS
jgi:hypothetical protein